MDRQLRKACQDAWSIRCEMSADRVPQEHTQATDNHALPRDWSHLGRRVLARAWRRFMDDLADRQAHSATPVVSAPQTDEEERA